MIARELPHNSSDKYECTIDDTFYIHIWDSKFSSSFTRFFVGAWRMNENSFSIMSLYHPPPPKNQRATWFLYVYLSIDSPARMSYFSGACYASYAVMPNVLSGV